MGDSKDTSRTVEAYTRVEAVGEVTEMPNLLPLGKKRDPVAQGELHVGDDVFGLRAVGKLADRLAATEPGTWIKVVGKLHRFAWTRTDKVKQERVVIAVDELQTTRRANRENKK